MISIGRSTGSTQTVTSRTEYALDVMTSDGIDETVIRVGSLGTLYPPPELRRRGAELVLRSGGADVLTVSDTRGTVVASELTSPSVLAETARVTQELACPGRLALGADGDFGVDATATATVRRLLVAADPVAGAFAPDEDAYVAVFRGPIRMEGELELESQVLATTLRVGTVYGSADGVPVQVASEMHIAADVDMAPDIAPADEATTARRLRVASLEARRDVSVQGSVEVQTGDLRVLGAGRRVVAPGVSTEEVLVEHGSVQVAVAYPGDAAVAYPLKVSVSNESEVSIDGEAGVVCVTPQRRLGVGTGAPRADLHVVDGATDGQDAVVVVERFSSNPAPTLLVRGTSLLSGETELLRLDGACNLTLHAGATAVSAPGATATFLSLVLGEAGGGVRTPSLHPAAAGAAIQFGGDVDLAGAQLLGVADLAASTLAVAGTTALAGGAVSVEENGDAIFPDARVLGDAGGGGALVVTGSVSGRASVVAEAAEATLALRHGGGDAGLAFARRGGTETVLFHTFPDGGERDVLWTERTIDGLATANETCLHRAPAGDWCALRVTESVGRDAGGVTQTSAVDLALLPTGLPGRVSVATDLSVAGELLVPPPPARTPPTDARCGEIVDALADVLGTGAAAYPELADADGNLRLREALAVLWGAVRDMRAA